MPATYYHSIEHNALVYDLDAVAPHIQYLPDARPIDGKWYAVPISLSNLQTLNWLGLPVIPPLNHYYDWPHGSDIECPFRAQIITANFLALNPRAFCLSEMRTGKTLSLLWAADFVMRQYAPGECRAIIAAPLSIMRRVWGATIFNHFLGRRTYQILHGDRKERIKQLATPADFYVINHDGVGTGSTMVNTRKVALGGMGLELSRRTDIKIAIVDEISAYRDGTTTRSQMAYALLSTRPYIWGATGTPTPNGPLDAYGQARMVNGAYGETFRNYRARTMFQQGKWKWVPGRGAMDAARKLLSPSIRFEMKDCTDVPPKLPPQLIDVKLAPEQAKAYQELKRSAILMVDHGVISAANEAVLRSKLIQVACGVIYKTVDNARQEHLLGCAPRITAMREVIEQAGEKIIIMAHLTSVLGMLYKTLAKSDTNETGYRCAIFNGQVSPKKRDEIISRFCDGDLQIILADPGTLSHGLDLSVSRVMLWFSLPEKTEQYLQACERIRGPRQKYPTLVAHLTATAVEREIYRRLEARESLQGAMLSLIREASDGSGPTAGLFGRTAGAAPPGYQSLHSRIG